jgi:hypothetical protein
MKLLLSPFPVTCINVLTYIYKYRIVAATVSVQQISHLLNFWIFQLYQQMTKLMLASNQRY